jgi:hypothetical protein
MLYVGYLGTGYPKVGPQSPFGPFTDQPPAGNPARWSGRPTSCRETCMTERPTNPTRRSSRPSPCRLTLRGGVADQAPVEQTCKAERPTICKPSNPERWRTKHNAIDPHGCNKTRHHQPTSEYTCSIPKGHREVTIDMTIRPHKRSQAYPH